MTIVRIRDKESFDAAMRRLKRASEKEGVLREYRKRERHEPESSQRQKRIAAAKRRWEKKLMREDQEFGAGATRGGRRGGRGGRGGRGSGRGGRGGGSRGQAGGRRDG